MDTKTLILANMIGNFVVVVFMLSYNKNHLTRTNNDHFISQVFLTGAFSCYSIGYYIDSFDVILTILGNASLIFGGAYMFITISRLAGKLSYQLRKRLLVVSAILSAFSAWLVFVNPISNIRIAIVTATMGIFFMASSYELLRRSSRSHLQTVIAAFFAIIGFGHFYRVLEALDFSRTYVIDTPGLGQSMTMVGMFVFLIVSGSGMVLLAKESADDQLFQAATYDGLTGVYNRQSFVKLAQKAFLSYKYNRESVALVMVDLDNFKQLNDTYGHIWGDRALIHFTRLIKKQLGPLDEIGRYGGDEFILVIQSTSKDNIMEKCESIRQNVENALFENVKLTSTFGIAFIDSESYQIERTQTITFDAISKCADDALYHAKAQGKNTVYALPFFPEEPKSEVTE